MRLLRDHNPIVDAVRQLDHRVAEGPVVFVRADTVERIFVGCHAQRHSFRKYGRLGMTVACWPATLTFTAAVLSSVPMVNHTKTPARKRTMLARSTQIPGLVTRR